MSMKEEYTAIDMSTAAAEGFRDGQRAALDHSEQSLGMVGALVTALDGLLSITQDSTGVAGYHLSGNVAEWDEFHEVITARDVISAYRATDKESLTAADSQASADDSRKLSDLGNELHNLSCHVVHVNEGWAEQIGKIACELWKWPQARAAQPAPVVPEGWRVFLSTSAGLRDGDRWEVYGPNGGGIVSTHDVKDWAVRGLLDALADAPAQGQQVEWRTTAVMLEQANAGLAQLNGKLRAELSALKAQQVGQEPQRCQCCGYLVTESEHRGCLRAAAPQPAPSQDVAGLASSDPVAKAEFETRLRKEFESRWPKPKGVTWGAGINDYCVSEFAEGIALSYPDMWMAYKAGAMRTNQ